MFSSKKTIFAATVCEFLGINKLFYKLNRNRKKIIAYHNVVDDQFFDDAIHLDYSINESLFRKHLDIIKKNFDVDLDVRNSKSVQITFDDGYSNQISKATKILDEYGFKGFVFACADLIDSEKPLDIENVMYWFSYVPEGTYNFKKLNLVLNIKNNNDSRREAITDALQLINENFSLTDLLVHLNEEYNFDNLKYDGYKDRFAAPSMDEVNDMKKRGHFVGAHSSKHHILAKLSKENLTKDINKCGEFLKKGIYNTDVFCYPYGNRHDLPSDISELLKANNFPVAISYENTTRTTYDRYYIPRIILSTDKSTASINFTLSGAKHFLVYRQLFPKINWAK